MESYDIITVMRGELDNVNELLSLVKKEQNLLVHGQHGSIMENVALQNKTALRLKALERYRNKMPATAISEVNPSQLEKIKDTLQLAVDQVKQINRQNRQLIHRSLSLVRHQLQYLIDTDKQVEGYTDTGDYAASVPSKVLNTTV